GKFFKEQGIATRYQAPQCAGPKPVLSNMPHVRSNVRFSNRPFRVKRFQTIHHYSVDVAHGLVLLFGIGTRGPSIMGFEDEVEQSFGRPCRQTNGRSKRTCELTGNSESRASRIKARVKGAAPWMNSATPSGGYPNSCADSGYIR